MIYITKKGIKRYNDHEVSILRLYSSIHGSLLDYISINFSRLNGID